MRHYAKGTIRWVDANTWALVSDAGHRHEGVASVDVSTTAVTINFDFAAQYVVTCAVTADESFTKKHVSVGASVGLACATLSFSMPGVAVVNPKQLSAAGANVWFIFELGTDDPPETPVPPLEC